MSIMSDDDAEYLRKNPPLKKHIYYIEARISRLAIVKVVGISQTEALDRFYSGVWHGVDVGGNWDTGRVESYVSIKEGPGID